MESQLMDSELGRALAGCNTSNAWSTLDAVVAKVGKRLGRPVDPRDLENFMISVGDEALR